jgi:hypothetical protein
MVNSNTLRKAEKSKLSQVDISKFNTSDNLKSNADTKATAWARVGGIMPMLKFKKGNE